MKKVVIPGLCVTGVVAIGWLLATRDGRLSGGNQKPVNQSEADTRFESFVTSNSCRTCHPDQHSSWHATYHRTMTQKASPASVVGNFNDVRLSAYGRDYHLHRKDDEFLVTMVPPEWELALSLNDEDPALISDPPIVTRPVVQTTGSHLMQTYWIKGVDRLHQVPWFFHIEEQMWIPAEDSFLAPPDGERVFSIWNMQCIGCHATGGQPGLNQSDGKLRTRVPELGIACEACHGSAREHVEYHASNEKRPGTLDPIFNPGKADHVAGSQACGQCHSSTIPHNVDEWLNSGSKFRPGDKLTDSVAFEFLEQAFWRDGTSRVGGNELTALMQSRCYLSGSIGCTSCHSMHNSDPTDQLRRGMESNEACFQCHDDYRGKLSAHTHHADNSSGSQCYNCHMPHTSYALFKSLRSHRIDSPSVHTSLDSGRPNACNLCHLDQTLQWTADHLTEWFGHKSADVSNEQKAVPASLLWLLKGDAMQRVTAAWSYGWEPARQASGEDWQALFLAATLTDPYSAVRFVAWRAMKKRPDLSAAPFEFTNDLKERMTHREAALDLVKKTNPSLPRIGQNRPLGATDYPQLLKLVEEFQAQRDDRRIRIPE